MRTEDLSRNTISKIELKSYGFTRVLESSVEIAAPVSDVWRAFSDYEGWAKWNTFIPHVRGEVKPGNTIEISVNTPGLKEMIFKPVIFESTPEQKVSWGGGFLFLYDGVHDFIFKPLGEDRTLFMQMEKFAGPMVLFMNSMIRKTAEGYINMNEEFKDYLEKK